MLLLVWGADTGAYFAGRRFGKVKLAVHVSPAKSREGAYGGLVLTFLIALTVAISLAMPSLEDGCIFAGFHDRCISLCIRRLI